MGLDRQGHADGIARFDAPARHDDRHDTRAANDFARCVTGPHLREKAFMQTIDLTARISKSRHFDARIRAEREKRSGWQGEQIDTSGRDVLTECTGLDLEALLAEFPEEFALDEVDLAKIGLGRIRGDATSMFHRLAAMDIALDAQALEEAKRSLAGLREGVGVATREGEDARRVESAGHRAELHETASMPQGRFGG
jgi:hypothetical protein